MEKDVVLKVEGLHKKFSRSLKRNLLYGTTDILRSMLGINYDSGVLRKGEFWSLENINFELKKGETIGLVGANGSGKSTLLRLINGIFPPDAGKISVRGRIGALIAVGAGFHPHMTGRENVYLNGVIIGMTRKEVEAKFDEIIKFAEIGEFIDAPVSTYSSGMYVRLGFAIAIHAAPDIILIDEVLAVGDSKFQRKCLDKITELREKSETSFILVSHNMQNIEAMCSKAVLLHKGRQIMVDTPKNIIPVYELMLQTGEAPENFVDNSVQFKESADSLDFIFKYPDFGTDEVIVNKISLIDEDGKPTKRIRSSDKVILRAEIETERDLGKSIIFSTFNFVNDKSANDKDSTALALQERINIKKGKSTIEIVLEQAQLTTGEYKIGFHIFDETYSNPYTQGFYGYFTSKAEVATMLRVGKGTPYCWIKPEIKIIQNQYV